MDLKFLVTIGAVLVSAVAVYFTLTGAVEDNTKEIDNIKIGSKIEILLEKIENFSGNVVVSREKARRAQSWKKMENTFSS